MRLRCDLLDKDQAAKSNVFVLINKYKYTQKYIDTMVVDKSKYRELLFDATDNRRH